MAKNALTRQHRTDPRAFYPLVDTVTRISNEDDTVHLPAGMFVDATVYAPGGGERQYISSLTLGGGLLRVAVGDLLQEICSGQLDLSTNNTQIPLFDSYQRPCGMLIGNPDLAELVGGMPSGTWTFDVEATELVSSCVIPQPQRGVDGLLDVNGQFLSGDVWLVGGNGVVLEANVPNNAVVVNIVGDPLFVRRKCQQASILTVGTVNNDYIAPRPLRKIRLVLVNAGHAIVDMTPDEFGTIFLTPGSNQASDNVLRVEPQSGGGLKLKALGTGGANANP
jgi:hypothetical protein